MKTSLKTIALAAALLGATAPAFSQSQLLAAEPTKTVALVHGAFADGSSWSRVIPLLQAEGLRVVAVQNPLTSLADDVAATKRAIETAPGPVILVGHSWGGMVITEAGAEDKVKALVYVAAFALPKGQSVNGAFAGSPPAPWIAELRSDSAGYMRLSDEAVGKFFAQDVSKEESAVIAATQVPTFGGIFDERLSHTAYEGKPSWFVVPKADGAIPPQMQEAMATAIDARITELDGSHFIMWSKPREVADVIIEAADSVR